MIINYNYNKLYIYGTGVRGCARVKYRKEHERETVVNVVETLVGNGIERGSGMDDEGTGFEPFLLGLEMALFSFVGLFPLGLRAFPFVCRCINVYSGACVPYGVMVSYCDVSNGV